MSNLKINNVWVALFGMIFFISACQQPGKNSSGSEYMPDMAHSVAYEANTYSYYYNNTWGGEDEYYHYAQPRVPVKGTVARGAKGANANASYNYGNTDEERNRAIAEIVKNPLPITDEGLAKGKDLYNVSCGICHGEKGDGAGYLVRDPGPGDVGGKYPVQPANFLLDDFVNSSNGRYYHAIMYGRNLMGGYADKLSVNERWEVIHYIRSLQAKDKKLVYNQKQNTLNSIDIPSESMVIPLLSGTSEGGHSEVIEQHSGH